MRRLTIVVLLAGAVLAMTAAVAQAHVVVSPKTAAPGSFQELTFQAPNESADARFVKLVVHFPAAHPLASMSPREIDGWTVTTAKAPLPKPITTDDGTVTEYISQITWTADAGGGIPTEQYQDFTVSAGPLPESGSLEFTADQYYSDGSVVHWNQSWPAGTPEPEHPAPVLTIAAAPDPSSSDALARVLGAAGLGVGMIAFLTALAMVRRRPAGGGRGETP
jgi:uncharacterized protein YcnI